LKVDIPVVLLLLFLIGMFASGYGFGNWVESTTLKQHDAEVEVLTNTIDELYTGLEMVYKAYTGDAVTEQEAREAAQRAEWLLTIVHSPQQVEAAAE
jgi:hypothetical protein